jgi:integrase/recombinase XerC
MTNSLVKVDRFPSEMVTDMHELLPKYFVEELSGLATSTLKVRRTDLKKFLYFFETSYVSLNAALWYPRDTRLFMDALGKEGYSPAYINRNLASIKSFGRWLWRQRYLNHDPVKGVREIQIEQITPKAIADKDWNRFQKACEILIAKPRSIHTQDFRNKVMALTLEGSGLRIEELLSLQLKQFVGNKFINVVVKGNKLRPFVSLKKEVAELIREYVTSYRTPGTSYLFTNRYGGKLSRNGIAQALNKIALVAGSAFSEAEKFKVHPHLFRHTHAKRLYDATHDPLLVARRLGHGSGTKYVGRYATPTDKEIETVIEHL